MKKLPTGLQNLREMHTEAPGNARIGMKKPVKRWKVRKLRG